MFPSASIIKDKLNVEEDQQTLNSSSQNWLHSSTYNNYDKAITETKKALSYSDKLKYETEIKEQACELKKASLLKFKKNEQKKAYNSQNNLFKLDSSGNKNIYKYGCVYEGDVPKFKIFYHRRILGFKNLRLLDLSVEALKSEAKKNKRIRYFYGKKNRQKGSQKATYIGPTISEKDVESVVFIPFETADQATPIHVTSIETNEQTEFKQKVADLNNHVYQAPKDVKAWLELIELQLKDYEFSDQNADSNSRRLVILEKQIAILERALTCNSGNIRLRLLLVSMREFATEIILKGESISKNYEKSSLSLKDAVAREWSQLVFTFPQFISVWRGYIAHLRGRFSSFGSTANVFSRIDALYCRALTTLSGILSGRILSHKPNYDTADQTIDLLAEYCHWLSQAGYTERALSIWQASIEFSCFCPQQLQSVIYVSLEQRHKEFERFWNSPEPRFGLPGARGWNVWFSNSNTLLTHHTINQNNSVDSFMIDLDEDWGINSPTAVNRWTNIKHKWNQTVETAENMLINFNSNVHSNVNQLSIGSMPVSGLDNLQTRGLAWLGLERTRESVGWLPAQATHSGDELEAVEDTDHLTTFNEVRPCLIEAHLQSGIDQTELNRRCQRTLLMFLEFIGIWDCEIAAVYDLPTDIKILHELSNVSSLRRQRLSPREFGFVWLSSPEREETSSISSSTVRARNCLASATLEQSSRLFPDDEVWQSSISQLRFGNLTNMFTSVLASQQKLSAKTVLDIWRKKAKHLLTSSKSQADLNLWRSFANGLVHAGHTSSTLCKPFDAKVFFSEARKVFTSTLRMYPVPPNHPDKQPASLEALLPILLPRLRIAHSFMEFQMCVNTPIDSEFKLSDSSVGQILQLLQYVGSGGMYSISETTICSPGPIELAEAASLLLQRLDHFKILFSNHPWQSEKEGTRQNKTCMHQSVELAAVLASFLFHLQILILDETQLGEVYQNITNHLQIFDSIYVNKFANQNINTKKSRWSENDQNTTNTDNINSSGCSMRWFLDLIMPGITAISVLKQRNRCAVIENLFTFNSTHLHTQNKIDKQIPLVITPHQWTNLLPYRVAAPCTTNLSHTFTIDYQRKLQGLLPPLVLSSIAARFQKTTDALCRNLTDFLTYTSVSVTIGKRLEDDKKHLSSTKAVTLPSIILGMTNHQFELLVRLLPSSLDLISIGLELDRWTSLLASSSSNQIESDSNCLNAVTRIRAAFEKALLNSPVSDHLTRFQPSLPLIISTISPSFWIDHLRIVLWSAYMAFEWTVSFDRPVSTTDSDPKLPQSNPALSTASHRKQRAAIKAIFYRAIEDIPWAKVLYTDLARYCPEDVEEIVDILSAKELRLRTPLEEIDLLMTSKSIH